MAQHEYSPFGVETFTGGSYADNPFRFSSEYFDIETNLVYYNYRYYSPELGRWLSKDPIGEAGGLNLYGFIDNYGVNGWDELGLSERGDGYDVEKNAQEYNKILGRGEQNVYDMAKWDATIAVEAGLWFAPIGRIGEFVSRVSKAAWGPISRTIGKICGKCGGKAAGAAEARVATAEARGTGDAVKGTEVVQRWMSKAELSATEETGLLRGGRSGTHYVTDAANSSAQRARERLALGSTPEVRVTLEVQKGTFSAPSKIQPAYNMPGGGMERTATGNVPVKIIKVNGK